CRRQKNSHDLSGLLQSKSYVILLADRVDYFSDNFQYNYNFLIKNDKNQTTSYKSGDNYIHREIFEIIGSNDFWDQIKDLVKLLTPYCKLLNMLQRDKACLFKVTFSMAYLLQFWESNSDNFLATQLIGRLERRWNEWEQPILLLSVILHPKYRINQFQATAININYPTFGKWLSYYYRAWTGQEPKCILREFNNFHNVLSYWCYVKDATDELGLVACRIFGICVNAASVERLWSCMGFIQTNRRSRLKTPKALNMSKLRADITYQHRRELDDLFSTFFNTASTHVNTTMHDNAHSDTTSTQMTHDNTTLTQTIHSNTTSTQMTHDNTTLTQTIHSNTNIDSSDKTQNEYLGADNKDEDNEECDLPYISEAEFGEYLQEW
ncbi:22208_t:CDS:2, partial [Gigaspora rosea]